MSTTQKPTIGPILFLDNVTETKCEYAALFVVQDGSDLGPITIGSDRFEPTQLATFKHATVYRIRFEATLNAECHYVWNEQTYTIASLTNDNLRLAFVSCNGEEHGDLDREDEERNVMWARLRAQHQQNPIAMLLHGGDQIYADEATLGHPLSEEWPDQIPRDPSRADLNSLEEHLREKFFERYVSLYSSPDLAWLSARVPSLMQWDDHDICDGWGSLPRSRTYSPVGQTLFSVARESYLLFQHAAVDGDLPARFPDQTGDHLGWRINSPDLRIIAPDLRSQRTRREVMGETGWAFLEAERDKTQNGQTFLVSSVPLLGPRLSIFEALMVIVPKMQKYEDDLRDQWQSRAHRASWRRMLELVRDMSDGHDVVALSGEIHLATRATMPLGNDRDLHQLVASGITHRPPPKGWARLLGAIASLGENPLPGHPISIRSLPGQPGRYTADRNYLLLERRNTDWGARWDLEQTGMTPELPL